VLATEGTTTVFKSTSRGRATRVARRENLRSRNTAALTASCGQTLPGERCARRTLPPNENHSITQGETYQLTAADRYNRYNRVVKISPAATATLATARHSCLVALPRILTIGRRSNFLTLVSCTITIETETQADDFSWEECSSFAAKAVSPPLFFRVIGGPAGGYRTTNRTRTSRRAHQELRFAAAAQEPPETGSTASRRRRYFSGLFSENDAQTHRSKKRIMGRHQRAL
jgi:hypothetical protein